MTDNYQEIDEIDKISCNVVDEIFIIRDFQILRRGDDSLYPADMDWGKVINWLDMNTDIAEVPLCMSI